ncbi:MAG: hypothetical protein WC663_03905 [Patescibacteria group bacterium]|jgi:hypothetical protein
MASPITHIILTAKIFDNFFKDRNKKEFFVGTCLPDIRYLKVIEREKTHFENIKMNDLKKENSFLAGLKFHSIVDQVREDFIVKNNTYKLFPQSRFSLLGLKLAEDRILYNHVQNWQEYIDYFNDILIDEINLGLKKEDIKKWHTMLQQLFSHYPNKKSIQNFSSKIFFSNQDIDEFDKIATQLSTDKKIINIIENLYNNFDTLIKNYK